MDQAFPLLANNSAVCRRLSEPPTMMELSEQVQDVQRRCDALEREMPEPEPEPEPVIPAPALRDPKPSVDLTSGAAEWEEMKEQLQKLIEKQRLYELTEDWESGMGLTPREIMEELIKEIEKK